ncbi:AMP-activated protein kinase beta subunit [Gracilaria domingensis]|nr:AMP-activated protein kinase beta subunit [Gracilaria domingensis]
MCSRGIPMGASSSRQYAPLTVDRPRASPCSSLGSTADACSPSCVDARPATCHPQQPASLCTRHSAVACGTHCADAPTSPPDSGLTRRQDACNHLVWSASAATTASDDAFDEDDLVPTMFHWNFGGCEVFVAGDWDGWATKAPMSKNGQQHIALVYIPCGQHQFKYYVDHTWQCAPNLPTCTDSLGNKNNLVTVSRPNPQFDLTSPLSDSPPLSPVSSYNQTATGDLPNDAPLLPPFLEARYLKPLQEDMSPDIAVAAQNAARTWCDSKQPLSKRSLRPFFSHVTVDHLYVARSLESDPVRSFSHNARHYGKIINTVFVTSAEQHDDVQNSDNFHEGHPS